jgi:hypothetical protein
MASCQETGPERDDRPPHSDDPEEQMPPPKHRAKHPVKARDIEVLRQWIAEGAKFESHWAYKPVTRPKGGGIDGFIRAKLAEKGIPHSPEADPITLIKRATYDLHGLPPTPEEVDAFLHSSHPPLSPMKPSSTASSPPNASASAGAATGSTWHATLTATAMKKTARVPMRGVSATG